MSLESQLMSLVSSAQKKNPNSTVLAFLVLPEKPKAKGSKVVAHMATSSKLKGFGRGS